MWGSPLWGSPEPGPSSPGSLFDEYSGGNAGPSYGGLVVGETKCARSTDAHALCALAWTTTLFRVRRVGRSSALRRDRVRLNVYLNIEGVGVSVVGGPRGHGTIVMLPVETDTLEEVMRLIQLKLDLEKRLLFACELFLPDGTVVQSFSDLVDAAAIDTPIIVGCGEPFDGTRVPMDLLEFHKQGGGRVGPKKVNAGLASTRQADRFAKAELVREAGHGLLPNSLAVATARTQTVDHNRGNALAMREYYLQTQVRRTAEQEDLKTCAKQNIQFHRMEKEERRMRIEEKAAQRQERMIAERDRDRLDLAKSKREDAARAQSLHDKVGARTGANARPDGLRLSAVCVGRARARQVKVGTEVSRTKKKAHSERYRREARKEADEQKLITGGCTPTRARSKPRSSACPSAAQTADG
jgi:hypothetical protein